jgi:glucose-1-phosphate thymidylyltransferase
MPSIPDSELIGLVPAAGRGTRLGLPYPKELYPIIVDNRYKPVAQHVLENLVGAGARHVVAVVNESKHQLMAYFGNGHRFGCELSYVVQESDTAGTTPSGGLAEALDAGYHLTRGKTVLFGMADTIVQPTDAFRTLVDERHAEADLVLGLFETDQPWKFGMVELDETRGIRRIIDKPAQSELTSMWGCMLWRPRFTEFLHEGLRAGTGLDFAGILNAAVAEGMRIVGAPIPNGSYLDVGTWEEIQRLEERYRR